MRGVIASLRCLPLVKIVDVYRKLAVVVGWLGLRPTQGCGGGNKVSWSGLVVNTIGGAANATRGKFLALESCREALIFIKVGPAERGSRGLAVHIPNLPKYKI